MNPTEHSGAATPGARPTGGRSPGGQGGRVFHRGGMLGSWGGGRDVGGLLVKGREPASSNRGAPNPLLLESGQATRLWETQPPVSKVELLSLLSGFVGRFSDWCPFLPLSKCSLDVGLLLCVPHPHPRVHNRHVEFGRKFLTLGSSQQSQ